MQAMRRNRLQARIFSQEPADAILTQGFVATRRIENHELIAKALPQKLLDRRSSILIDVNVNYDPTCQQPAPDV
jgi:hypothetical protein